MRQIIPVSCFVLMLVVAPVTQAARPAEDLKKVEANLQQEKKRQQELETSRRDLEAKLDEVQGALLEMTGNVQAHEKAVLKLHTAQAETETKIKTMHEELDNQRQSLAHIIMALQRLNRVPPQALLARPSAPIDMARSFDMLQKIIPSVAEQAAEIKQTVETLAALRETQKQQEKDLLAEQKILEGKQNKLAGLLKERKKLLAENNAQQQQATRKMAALASQARDLRGLMQQLERQERVAPTPKPAYRSVAKTLQKWLGLGGGAGRLPVAGNVETGFGEEMPGGGQSQGLRINAASGAIVTAPSAGIVRFAGPFRQYKLLVIVQHDNGEHSLLGGLQEVYTATGAHVVAGEPLGKLPKLEGDSSRSASLYYERRRNGKPIDPRQSRG